MIQHKGDVDKEAPEIELKRVVGARANLPHIAVSMPLLSSLLRRVDASHTCRQDTNKIRTEQL